MIARRELYVSFAKEPCKRDYILQKRPLIYLDDRAERKSVQARERERQRERKRERNREREKVRKRQKAYGRETESGWERERVRQ